MAFESIKEAKIFVHIIKGENVPVRHEFISEYKKSKDNVSQSI